MTNYGGGNTFKDVHRDIRYGKAFKFLLPNIEGEGYFGFIAARMNNYMLHIMETDGFKPSYYKLEEDKVILGDHVAYAFLGLQIYLMLCVHPFTINTWLSREPLLATSVAMDSIPCGALRELLCYIHYVGNLEIRTGFVKRYLP